jgi:two-component system, sensor histidine kinase
MSTSNLGFEAADTHPSQALQLACNPQTPVSILDILSNHESIEVLTRLAENSSIGSQTLSKLCRHQMSEVRASASENSRASLNDLLLLAKDDNPDVRYRLAENHQAPESVLQLLSQDDNPYVSQRALTTIRRIQGKTQSQDNASITAVPQPADPNNTSINYQADNWQELSKLNSQLTGRVMELSQANADLQTTLARYLETSNLQSKFVTNLSHDLRTPLSAIIGMNELLLSTDLSSEQLTLANAIQESANTLLNIASDIADLSQLDAGNLELETVPFNVIFLVQDLARAAAASAKKRQLLLTTKIDQRIPEFVLGDPGRLREILLNLIGNSIQCCPPGEVTIEVLVAAESNQQITLHFAVKDSGSFSLNDDEQIIPSAGCLSSEQKYESMRVGLALSKQLIELLGGHLQVTSANPNDSTVSFCLTYALAENIQVPPPAAEPVYGSAATPMQNCLLLVVEDNPISRSLVVKQLANLGIQAQSAATGAEAVAAAADIAFDLILMDCHLPEIDGFEATKTIRQLESKSGRHTPVIALTADALKGNAEKCMAAGMDDYLSKPVSIEQLRQKIQQWLPLTKRHEYSGNYNQQTLRLNK